MNKKQKTMEEVMSKIDKVNAMRVKHGYPRVERQWTGCAHWLSVPDESPCGYRQVSGSLFHSDDAFIGFLEGLAYAMAVHDNYRL